MLASLPPEHKETRQGSGRSDHAKVSFGGMRDVSSRPVARSQTPAVKAISEMVMRIADAMPIIDLRVTEILLPVVGVSVA